MRPYERRRRQKEASKNRSKRTCNLEGAREILYQNEPRYQEQVDISAPTLPSRPVEDQRASHEGT